jgi:hypothetical protein
MGRLGAAEERAGRADGHRKRLYDGLDNRAGRWNVVHLSAVGSEQRFLSNVDRKGRRCNDSTAA